MLFPLKIDRRLGHLKFAWSTSLLALRDIFSHEVVCWDLINTPLN